MSKKQRFRILFLFSLICIFSYFVFKFIGIKKEFYKIFLKSIDNHPEVFYISSCGFRK